MNDYVVWLDSKNARIYKLKFASDEPLENHLTVSKNEIDHHTRHNNDKRTDANEARYYGELASELKNVDRLLLMGPGRAKTDFKGYLEAHHKIGLAKKVIGAQNFESFEHKSEKQMMAAAKSFFKNMELKTIDAALIR